MKNFKHYNSLSEYQNAIQKERPMIADMPDGAGTLAVFRPSGTDKEYILSKGAGPFRAGMSVVGGQSIIGYGNS